VHNFASKYMADSARAVVYGLPGNQVLAPEVPAGKVAANDKPESINEDEPWRATPPAGGPDPALVIPAPVQFRLPNGLNVVLDYRKDWPVVAASLLVRSGTGANPVSKPGLSNFAIGMLDEGTTTRSATQFAQELEQVGAHIDLASAQDYSTMTLTAARSHIQSGFDLLADATMNPVFADAEIERERKSLLGDLDEGRADPRTIALRVLNLAMNGDKSSYGYMDVGTEDSVKATTKADLRGFWARYFVPDNATLIVSGALTQDEVTSMLSKTLGTWKAAANDASGLDGASTDAVPVQSRLVEVDVPGAAQTQLRVAVGGPPRSTPDYEPLQVMNAILGGLFSSRINLNLREQHGYTYGANSRFTYLKNTGWFAVSSGVRTDVTAPATHEVLLEIRKMGDTPVSEDEMKLAKQLLVGALPSRFQTTEQTVGALADVVAYDLGLNYYSEYARRVSAVSIAQVQDMSKKYLIPQKLIVIAVGDRKKIEPELKALGLGEIQLRDAEGKVIAVD